MDRAASADQHAARLLEGLPVAVVSFDRDFRMRYANGAAEALLRTTRDELLGRTQWELFPGTVGTELEDIYRRAMATGQAALFEQYYPPHDTWYEMSVTPVGDGLDVAFADVTSRERPAAAAGERVRGAVDAARLTLLTEVTQALGSTLNEVEGVRRLARLVVPGLADWCIVSLLDPETTRLLDLAVVHRDPGLQVTAQEYARERVGSLTAASPVNQALGTGRPVVIGTGDRASTDHIAQAALTDPRARQMLRALAPGAAVALPLTARGRVNGVLSIYRDVGHGVWDDGELSLAAEIAARAGMALDNARLYGERRDVALRLQEAMLTALPEPDHLELRARYLPAAGGEQVGGDWYDAVVLPTGATALAIGDIVGHDMVAAGRMGQVRTMLRTLAWEHAGPPSVVLGMLDRALDGLAVDTVATALYAVIEQDAQDEERGLRRLRWSNAGHPAPVLLHADARVEVLSGRTDVLLGVRPEAPRADHEHPLPPGSTLLLYTDGLIERRDRTLAEGLDRLTAALAAHADLPLTAMLDAVVADVVGTRHGDDIALLAARLHREDRPRPAEAGPGHVRP